MLNTTSKLGFYAAIVAFIAATGYCIAQLLQIMGIVMFPADAILIYSFSLGIAIPFLLAMLALHYCTPIARKIWSHAALAFSVMYATYAVLVYVVQLAVAIPQTMRGQADPIQVIILSEHSMFWNIDALAYLCMGLATLFGSFTLTYRGAQRWLKIFLFANGLITPLVALVYFKPQFSTNVLMLASPWVITLPGSMLLLALYFRKAKSAVSIELSFDTVHTSETMLQ